MYLLNQLILVRFNTNIRLNSFSQEASAQWLELATLSDGIANGGSWSGFETRNLTSKYLFD